MVLNIHNIFANLILLFCLCFSCSNPRHFVKYMFFAKIYLPLSLLSTRFQRLCCSCVSHNLHCLTLFLWISINSFEIVSYHISFYSNQRQLLITQYIYTRLSAYERPWELTQETTLLPSIKINNRFNSHYSITEYATTEQNVWKQLNWPKVDCLVRKCVREVFILNSEHQFACAWVNPVPSLVEFSERSRFGIDRFHYADWIGNAVVGVSSIIWKSSFRTGNLEPGNEVRVNNWKWKW